MECIIQQEIRTGDKNVFIGRVIEAYADESLIREDRKIEFAKGDFPRNIYATRFKKS